MSEDLELFKENQDSPSGFRIHKIIKISKNVLIFWDPDYNPCYEINDEAMINGYNLKRAKYDTLLHMIPKRNEIPEDEWRNSVQEVAQAFYSAIQHDGEDKRFDPFKSVENNINKLVPQRDAMNYYFFVFISMFFLISTFLFVIYYFIPSQLESIKLVLLCVGGGGLGSVFSALQRSNKLNIRSIKDTYSFALQSFVKIFIGASSGLILYFSSAGNLLAGFAQSVPTVLITLSIVSGFSERFIPDLLGKIERATIESNTEKPAE